MRNTGVLYIIATPIGNPDDITLRAIKTLTDVPLLICEETREARRLLKKINIPDKELLECNEHNQAQQAPIIIQHLLLGQDAALISDCGTPVFADPGHMVIKQAVEFEIPVIPVPGASSLMTLLSILDFPPRNFLFLGFLPRETPARKKILQKNKTSELPLILMDTPYRMTKLLLEIREMMGGNKKITLACDLTLPEEHIYRGTINSILPQVKNKKAEFMLIIHPQKK
jgi:16S rRNA (cytidine1402-2'-O)-methyltransferase